MADEAPRLSPARLLLLQKLRMERAREAGAGGGIPRRPAGTPAPLSLQQRRLWLLDQIEGPGAGYNIPVALRLRGPLDAAALERTLGEVVRRHEVLRTRFEPTDGEPRQVVEPARPFHLPRADLAGLPAAAREAELRRLAARDAATPFDLARAPLFRAALLRLDERDHAVLFTVHHAVSDGWSTGVLVREVTELYAAFSRGLPSPLPELPLQYGDFAAWQRDEAGGEEMERQLAYWRERLAGPAAAEIPADHPRGGGAAAASERFTLGPELTAAVRQLAVREGATPFMVLLAAFQLLLSRWAGDDDVRVGTAVAGRARPELEGLIGFFANTLVLRADLGGDPTFAGLLRRVREATVGAFQHPDVAYERLVEELAPDRGAGAPRLFQAAFTLDNTRAGDATPRLGELELETVGPGVAAAKFDLLLALADGGGTLGGALEYRAELWEPATARRMVAQYRRLLEAVVAAPELPVSAAGLLDAEERRTILDEWSGAAAPYPRDACIHTLFAEQAALTPDAVALSSDDERVTYAELDARSARLARRLVRGGVRPGECVGVMMERSAAMVAAFLAVLRAGGAYLPLDPALPRARMARMLADAGAARVLTTGALAARVDVAVLLVDEEDDDDGTALPPPPGPTAPAYVMFTSGSTGHPKGVAVPHRAVVRLVRGTGYAAFGPGETFLQLAPASFDASTLEIWGALLNGGRLAVLPPHAPSLDELALALRRHGVTTLWLTAGLFHSMAEAHPEALGKLRQLLAGGDRLSPAHVRRLADAYPALRLINGYGPTENTTFTCCHTVTPADRADAPVPLGRPIANTRVYLLDPALRPVPPGVPGELFAGGDGVALGYTGRPGLTAERFIPDPFSREPGARMYRTGDRARWRADGTVEFLGRLDRQVKIRGFRVEPGEVENALAGHPAVGDAAVVALGEGAERRLAAYVAAPGASPGELRAWLAERLPEHMVPTHLVVLDALPLTPNGKVDRRALPAPEAAQAYTAPRDAVEEGVAGLFAELLGAERVGVDDDFFALGGHSLLAMRLATRLRAAFGVEVPLRALFEAPTPALLAARVRAERGSALPPLEPVPRDGPLPLSFAQQRLWFLDRLVPGSPAYNVPLALRLHGALDEDALRRALDEVVRRHEVLRTVFGEAEGEPVQLVRPAAGVPLPRVDLRALPAAAREAEVRRRVSIEAARPFDLERGPLLRATLLRVADEERVALLTLHHIASDGWSMEVLARELSGLYTAFREGRGSPLPELPIQYADYAVRQRQWLSGEALEEQLAYWRDRLAGAPPRLRVPFDLPPTGAAEAPADSRALHLPPEVAQEVRALARREGATVFMVLLAAWQALLARWSGDDDVVVGVPVSGRTRAETEGLIGFFVNTLPLRADLSGEPTFRELLARVREAALGAYAHQELPFERMVEELGAERTLGHSPVFQVTFTLEEEATPGAALRLGDTGAERLSASLPSAKFDLALLLRDAGAHGVGGTLRFRSDRFHAGTAERVGRAFVELVRAAAADPDRRVQALALSRAEAGEAPPPPPPAAPLVHEAFAAQATRTPEAVAVVGDDGEALTYAALDARASRVAHALLRRGAGAEARVAILLERSPHLVEAILGTLRAGAAYVPLDPDTPDERLAAMLRESGAALVMATGELAARVPAGVDVLRVDGPEVADETPHDPGVRVDPASLAYLLFTSGSTGTPRAVAVEHRQIAAYTHEARARLDLDGARSFAMVSTPAADLGNTVLFPALVSGGALHLPSRERATSAEAWAARCREHPIDCLKVVPSHLAALMEGPDPAAALPRMRLVLGGEAAGAAWVERVRALRPECRVHNHYGPTETTVGVLTHPVDGPPVPGGSVPLGTPLPGVDARVLDGGGSPVPDGFPGELWIGGRQVARGYHGRPGLTAERFLPDPFSPEPGARMYRTGDRVRRLHGGELEFLGRVDRQVKIRGFRVEPGEVEAVVRAHPRVRDAAVAVRGEGAERQLVAYLVADDAAGMREYLRARLPEPMVPAHIVVLDALPLTPNGKVDRRALPAPEAHAAPPAPYAEPRTPTEEVLAGVWSGVLGVERVGTDDDFFALGGHSLLAMRVVSRVRGALGVELPLRALFEAPTLAALAAEVDRRRRGEPAAPPIVPVLRDGPLPLSFAQQRLWILDRLDPGSPAYNVPAALRLRGPLDEEALRRALQEVARRHEVLRTTFRAGPGGLPLQVVHPAGRVELPVADLRGLAAADRDHEVSRLAREEAERPFDLERGPLLRATLLRVADEERVALLTLHHIASDGWSMEVLGRELAALYTAFRVGRGSPLPDLPIQYADYAVGQRQWLRGDALEGQLAYWRDRLAGAPPLLALPTDHPRPAVASPRGAVHRFGVPAEVAREVRALARREGATVFMVLLAAWQALLARWTGDDDVVVGVPVSGRTRAEMEGLIGFFVNTLPLRADLSGEPTFRELLARVREAALDAYAHQELPFERMVEELGVERTLGHSPVFQVTFVYQSASQAASAAPLRLGEAGAERLPAALSSAKFDLTLGLRDTGEGELGGEVQYRADLFRAETAARVAGYFVSLLRAAAADPALAVAALPLAGAGTLRLSGGGAAPHAPPVHQAIAARAALTPGAVAVEWEGGSLSYAELDARSARLARHLRERGVGPDVRVALLLERSPELVVALLAVLGAGGAYVPLDPAYPDEWLRHVLGDSGAELLLTRSGVEQPDGFAGTTLYLDEVEPALGPGGPAEAGVHPDSLAYVIYTSGSTGRPKGVGVPHGALASHMAWMLRDLPLDADDRVLQRTSPAFDASVWELLAPLMAGARLVLASPEARRDPALLAREVAGRGITVLQVVPALLAPLALAPGVEEWRLRRLCCGGEALTGEALRRLWERLGAPVEVVNLYGPTEVCIDAAWQRGAGASGPVPLGRPAAGVRAYVLDARGRPLPVGIPGELHLGGVQVARGYLGRPGLTAERFVPDPFAGAAGARMYRTGDRARWSADGVLEYLGRMDQQIKVRGFRVEPGEIEAVLAGHPGVREAAVVARGEGERRRLVAFWVAAEDGPPAAGELREYLRRHLPEHMVPGHFAALPSLPLTPGGKLDRRALPAEEPRPAAARVEPRDPLEALLAGLWEEVLGAGPVGVEDDFFELGGHSLLAVMLVDAIERKTGMTVPLAALFAHPAVEHMARFLRRMETDIAPSALVCLQPRGNRRPVFLVHPAGGEVACYAPLVRHLGADRPVWGLRAPEADGDAPTVGGMADEYLAAVRRVQPEGPYFLGGWSMGGVVAHEMARRLESGGERVALLALVDSNPRGAIADEGVILRSFAASLALDPGRVPEPGAGEEPRAYAERVLAGARAAGAVPAELSADAMWRAYGRYRAHVQAWAAHTAAPIGGRATLFAAAGRAAHAAPGVLAEWERLAAGGVEAHELPGDHFGIVREPHVAALARLLNRALDGADSPGQRE